MEPVFMVAAMGLDHAKDIAAWGTRGKSGVEPLRYVLLKDCDTDHLQAILENCGYISSDYRVIIKSILSDRGVGDLVAAIK